MIEMNSRCIFIEGIPGAGKTTALETVSKMIQKQLSNVKTFYEGDLFQPADYEGVAFFSHEAFEVLLTKLTTTIEALYLEEVEDGILIHYKALLNNETIDERQFEYISKHDVYEQDVTVYQKLILYKWAQFSKTLESTEDVFIMDCCLLQNPLTMLQAKFDVSASEIKRFIIELFRMIEKYNPIVLYILPRDIRSSLQFVRTQRSNEWFTFVAHYYTQQNFGKNHDLTNDVDGVVYLLKSRVALEKSICQSFGEKAYIIERTQDSWNEMENTITSIISSHL